MGSCLGRTEIRPAATRCTRRHWLESESLHERYVLLCEKKNAPPNTRRTVTSVNVQNFTPICQGGEVELRAIFAVRSMTTTNLT
jgi:hypothetical protein